MWQPDYRFRTERGKCVRECPLDLSQQNFVIHILALWKSMYVSGTQWGEKKLLRVVCG